MSRSIYMFRVLSWIPDIVTAALAAGAFVLVTVALILTGGRRRIVPQRPRMLYVGYTTLDQAHAKGLLRSESDARQTYNPGAVLDMVTVFVPFGKRNLITKLSDEITFVERAEAPWPAFKFTQRILRLVKGCLETRRWALAHDVVMVGGSHVASLPGVFARLTTRTRFVLFIEAFWEDILPMQAYMSRAERAFWRRWYSLLYLVFDAYIGGPSYKPDFYVGRGMRRDRIWPYVHQINAEALEDDAARAELPAILRDLPGPLVISIGRLEKEKLSADCVAMAVRLAATGVDFRLVIVGEGTERPVLEAEIVRANLQDRVLLLGGQPNAVTYAIARRADACFAPYMGTALVEVLLAGCAVVAYDNDPHRGIAGDGPITFVPQGDVAASADALADMLRHPGSLAEKRAACRTYAWAKWSVSAVAEAFAAPLIGDLKPRMVRT